MSDISLESGSVSSRTFVSHILRGPGGAAFTTFAKNAITSERLMQFSKFLLLPVTFTRAQKMVRSYYHKILSGKPGERFFYLFGG